MLFFWGGIFKVFIIKINSIDTCVVLGYIHLDKEITYHCALKNIVLAFIF